MVRSSSKVSRVPSPARKGCVPNTAGNHWRECHPVGQQCATGPHKAAKARTNNRYSRQSKSAAVRPFALEEAFECQQGSIHAPTPIPQALGMQTLPGWEALRKRVGTLKEGSHMIWNVQRCRGGEAGAATCSSSSAAMPAAESAVCEAACCNVIGAQSASEPAGKEAVCGSASWPLSVANFAERGTDGCGAPKAVAAAACILGTLDISRKPASCSEKAADFELLWEIMQCDRASPEAWLMPVQEVSQGRRTPVWEPCSCRSMPLQQRQS